MHGMWEKINIEIIGLFSWKKKHGILIWNALFKLEIGKLKQY